MTEITVRARGEQHVAVIAITATFAEWGQVNALIPQVREWLAARSLAPVGPPVYRYLVTGGPTTPFRIEVGWPVEAPVRGDGRVEARVFPAGEYAVAVHRGHPDGIRQTYAEISAWAERTGTQWARDGEELACAFESYRTDPEVEPDANRWETEIAFLIRRSAP